MDGEAATGRLSITRFVAQGNRLFAVGNLVLGGIDFGQVQVPVDLGQAQASCEILSLVLGPLELNLLGLNVFLDTVILEITAEPGPGNLLGNLLCAIAGLLDRPGNIVNAIAQLLNQIIRILG